MHVFRRLSKNRFVKRVSIQIGSSWGSDDDIIRLSIDLLIALSVTVETGLLLQSI